MATTTSILVQIGAALQSTFTSAFNTTNSRVRELGAAVNDMNARMGDMQAMQRLREDTMQARDALAAARAKVDEMRAAVASTAGPLNEKSAALRNANAAARAAGDAYRAARLHADNLRTAAQASGEMTQEQADALNQARAAAAAAGTAWRSARDNAATLRDEVKKAEAQHRQHATALNRAESEANKAATAYSRNRGQLLEMGRAMRAAGVDTGSLTTEQERLARQLAQTEARYKSMARTQEAIDANMARRAELRGQMFDAVALGATVSAPLVQAANFETAMLGVAKQVEGARDENGQLTATYYEMGKAIQQMGREIPLATNDLAEMVTAGARMGVAKDELIDFTRTAAMMADAFELPAGQLADDMGKIAGLFKIPIPAIGELADSINYLDDNAISKGGDIINFLTRTGGVASAVKITGKEMAALGSTLLTMGEQSETAGTAVNAVFSKLAAADKGTKAFKAAMAEAGLSVRAVQAGMQKDAVGTLMMVMEAIGKLPAEKQLGVMVDLVGLEHSDTLAKLANNTEEFRRQLALANGEAARGSMAREFAARLQTTNAQFQIMRNRVQEVSVNLGSALLPAVNSAFGAMAPLIGAVADFARANPVLTRAVVGTVVALTTLRLATLAGAYGWTFLKGAGLQVVSMALRLGPALSLLSSGFAVMGAAIAATPVGWIVAGLAAVAVGAALVYRHWDQLKAGFAGFVSGVLSGMGPTIEAVRSVGAALAPLGPLVDMAGAAVGRLWGWFKELLQPVTMTSGQFEAATAAGQSFGQAVGLAVNTVLTPLRTVVELIAWVINNAGKLVEIGASVKSTVTGFGGTVMDKVSGWGDSIASTLGIGGDPVPMPANGAAPATVAGAAPVTAVNQTVTNQPTYNIEVKADGAGSPQAVADAVRQEMERREARKQADQRASMYDLPAY